MLRAFILYSLLILSFTANNEASTVAPLWPTPSTPFENGKIKPISEFIQPTASGVPKSGLFGCVRSNGCKFHEGIDIKPVRRDRKGEPLDAIVAIWSGKVAWVNSKPSNSGYGRYVVLEHSTLPAVYTLYAHLKSIEKDIKVGAAIQAGTVLGVMGHSAGGYKIPKERSHLHLEIGVRLTDYFQPWYNRQKFGSQNHNQLWNGINMIGMDPLDLYENFQPGDAHALRDYIHNLPTAFTMRVFTPKVPDFVTRYPSLVMGELPKIEGITGWEIDFTWYGLPKAWRALTIAEGKPKSVMLVAYNQKLLKEATCRNTLILKNGKYIMGDRLRDILELLFGF